MFEKFDADRGQVGIGTLIVFIAMVLVAAIAAGVLINTAGLLQSQAEATGEESSEQVSDRVQVVSVTGIDEKTFASGGTTPASNGNINGLAVSVRKAPGAGNIDLTNAVVEVFARGSSATLTEGGVATANEFGTTAIKGGDSTLSASSDRVSIEIDLKQDVQVLTAGDSVTVTITTAAGGTAFVEKRAPSTIDSTKDERFRL